MNDAIPHCTCTNITDLDRLARLLKVPDFAERPTYRVNVFKQGNLEATHRLAALDALEAIEAVEAIMGLEPPQVTRDRDGKLQIKGWHGFEFRARREEPHA